MVLIPEGARNIVIQEVQEAANFLAVRAAHSDKYYLNGNYIIQWNGEYQVGGVKFYYERSGNLENLTSPGPTAEPIVVQVSTHTHTHENSQVYINVRKHSCVHFNVLACCCVCVKIFDVFFSLCFRSAAVSGDEPRRALRVHCEEEQLRGSSAHLEIWSLD